MADDSDAGRILRDREHRKALERVRIDEERRDRQLELSRLRALGIGRDSPTLEEDDETEPKRFVVTAQPLTESSDSHARPAEEGPSAPTPPTVREIGGALRHPVLAEFLRTNPMDSFDIQALNTLRLSGLTEAARGDPALLAAVGRRAEALMVRVKQEADDPLSAGAFLREQVLHWYRKSPAETDWTDRMPLRWAGLFAESRVSGGRLEPWLNLRLWSLYDQASRAGPLGHRLRKGLTRNRRIENSVVRTPSQQIRAEVAQAILDDLAVRRRAEDAPVPLVRLSELAVRRQVPTVNDALALLFNAPETGPFVLLHPNRYPDCDEVQIRPPTGGATGAALAYSLVSGRSGRRPSGRGRSAAELGQDPGSLDLDDLSADGPEELDASTIWEAEEVDPMAWRRVIKERRRERHRLDLPPKDCRTRPAYTVLRELLLEDAEFCQAFFSVKWRGRPAGLPLLASLLHKGSLAPEVATDHEYLEAELGDLVQGDSQWHPSDGRWTTRGWTVVREGSHAEGFRFTAKRTDAASD
jgi:hypothetical protein